MKKLTKEQIARIEGYTEGYTDGAVDVIGKAMSSFINHYTRKDYQPSLIECSNGSSKVFFDKLIWNILASIPECATKRIVELGSERLKSWEKAHKIYGDKSKDDLW